MENDYIKQAEEFLKDTKTEFKADFFKHGLHFEDDKDQRDIYKISLIRGERVYNFKYGQSVNDSSCFPEERTKPTAYDVLTCLTKYNPFTFEDFCGAFGYDEDSRKAEKVYKAVVEEWENIKILYSDEEIEKLQEIQ